MANESHRSFEGLEKEGIASPIDPPKSDLAAAMAGIIASSLPMNPFAKWLKKLVYVDLHERNEPIVNYLLGFGDGWIYLADPRAPEDGEIFYSHRIRSIWRAEDEEDQE